MIATDEGLNLKLRHETSGDVGRVSIVVIEGDLKIGMVSFIKKKKTYLWIDDLGYPHETQNYGGY